MSRSGGSVRSMMVLPKHSLERTRLLAPLSSAATRDISERNHSMYCTHHCTHFGVPMYKSARTSTQPDLYCGMRPVTLKLRGVKFGTCHPARAKTSRWWCRKYCTEDEPVLCGPMWRTALGSARRRARASAAARASCAWRRLRLYDGDT
eukprot:6210115-Pleurochrysis_carterae.AAC.1